MRKAARKFTVDGERDPLGLERVAVCVRAEERDGHVRERHPRRAGESAAPPETETAGDDEQRHHDVRRPARVRREREDRE